MWRRWRPRLANALAQWLPNGRSIRRWRRLPTPRYFDIEPASRPCPSNYDSKGARTRPDASAFEVEAPFGGKLLTASIDPADLAQTRDRWQRAARSLALITLAISIALLCGPLLDWRRSLVRAAPYAAAAVLIGGAIVLSRLVLRLASPADWLDASVFSGAEYASPLLRPLLTSPFDYLLTAIAASSLVALLLYALAAWRLTFWPPRMSSHRPGERACGRRRVTGRTIGLFAVTQIAAGTVVAFVLTAYRGFLQDTVANTTIDLLHYSLHPWSTSRLALQVGLILWHATALGCGVLILRAALIPWSVPRNNRRLRAATIAMWALPLIMWQFLSGADRLPSLVALAVIIASVAYSSRLEARYRHGSQAYRLTMMTLGLLVPAVAFYPSMFDLGRAAKAQLVETRFAPQAINHRQTVQGLLEESLDRIDEFPGLTELVTAPVTPSGAESPTDRAFQVWRITALASYPVTSSVELFGPDGLLISRFAFNLPDDLTAVPRSDEQMCTWGAEPIFEEVSPLFAEDRRILHAGRALCDAEGRPVGSIIVHAMPADYANLPFIVSQSPYVELMRPVDPSQGEAVSGRDVEFAVYGWSRTPLYASDVTAWPLDDTGVLADRTVANANLGARCNGRAPITPSSS